MFDAVYDFGLDPAWAATIATVPALGNAFVQVGYLLDPINGILGGGGGANEGQTTSTQQGLGATADKKDRRTVLTNATLAVAGPLSAYGAAQGDHQIMAVSNITPSKLLTMRDGLLASRARSVHTLAAAHAAALVSRGVTSLELDALADAVTDWRNKVQRPRLHKALARGQSAIITKALKALDLFVKTQLDKLMLPFAQKDPGFYAAYKAARVIHDNPGGGGGGAPPPPP